MNELMKVEVLIAGGMLLSTIDTPSNCGLWMDRILRLCARERITVLRHTVYAGYKI